MRIRETSAIEINAPAETVWSINGEDFVRIGEWARAITISRPAEGPALPGAPASGRICNVPGFGEVHEHLEEFDPGTMSFRLTVRKGLPFFVTRSEFRSRVISTGSTTSRFEVTQTMEMLAFPGLLLYPLLRRKLGQAVAMVITDLKHRAEAGEPHPAKTQELRNRDQSVEV